MARKSNKTSHVLNLLTKGTPVSEKENTAKVTIVDESADDALSENILEKLEAELSKTEKKEEIPVAEEPVSTVTEREEPVKDNETAAMEEPIPMPEEAKPADFFNVMERLLERQDIQKYMNQYSVCKCPKCTADVKMRTLTNLPAKYISSEDELVEAAMNFYENKYKIRILTELIRSCIAVRNDPRHDNN